MTRSPEIAERQAVQRELLEDPIAFVWEAYCALTGPLEALLSGDEPRQRWANKDAAIELAALAARTPGSNMKRCFGEASDCANDLATSMFSKGLELGAVLEQLRQGLLRIDASLQEPEETAQRQAEELAELRVQLTSKECNHA